VLNRPDVQAAWAQQGAVPMIMNPAEFGTFVRADIEKWARVVKSAGLIPQ
jgi:tripartite-type tricarboxylate transporter receptor subunit TctC